MQLNGEAQSIYNSMCKLIHNRQSLEILIGNQIIEAEVITGDISYANSDGTMNIELLVIEILDLNGN